MSVTLDLLHELVSRPSVTPNDAGCQNLISQRLKALGFQIELMYFGEVTNLWARRGHGAPLFVFAGHTDVVPPGPLEAWATDPFTPTVSGDCLYGRGAADMKSGLAAMLIAVENFIQKHPDAPGSIGFLITSDEEGPSINGTKRVMQELFERNETIQYCVIGEATSINTLGDQIRVGRRGSLHGRLTIIGKQGHVAYPDMIQNPIHLAAPVIRDLVNETWDEGNEFFPPTTFQITNVHAGTGATNVVPGTIEILFNFRFSNAVTVIELQQKVTDVLEKYALQFNLQWELSGQPFLTKQGKLINAVQETVRALVGVDPILSTGGGTSDGRFIAPTGAEVIELGPCYASVHQANEHVRTSDVDKLTVLYEHILTKTLL